MSEGSENKRRCCWIERSELEKGLFALLILATLLISTLGVLLLLYTNAPSKHCVSPACVKSAAEILNRIDSNINPCEDFYAFACNNMPSTTDLDFYPPFTELIQRERARIKELFIEPIEKEDHPLVKMQKTMYDSCMDVTAIAENTFPTLKEILKLVGGWPVLEEQWNSGKFDWVQTTYRLRNLGYAYNSFLELNIVPDPDNNDKYIFEVSIPKVRNVYSKWFDSDEKNGFMTDVAIALGAEATNALSEMSDTYQFLNDLQWQREAILREKVQYHRSTIEEFQLRENSIKWIKFISTIAGPDVSVSASDVVLFPTDTALRQWFGLINRTRKRTQANYMLWRVVEEVLPYLTEQLQAGRVKPKLMANVECETRSQFCIEEIRKRFSPSPIDIMYLRKYLPTEKREAVRELVRNMESALMEITEDVGWMTPANKKAAINELKKLYIVVGAPGDYFNDRIFGKAFHMNISTDNFLKLLSEANRHNRDRLYRLIDKSTSETKIAWKDVTANSLEFGEYETEITLLASIIQDPIYDEKQPNYLNYANMGLATKYYFLELFRYASRDVFLKNEECLASLTLTGNISIAQNMPVDELVAHNLGLKVSYKAYKKWAKDNEELSLFALDYTPEQLFWISSGYLFCQYTKQTFDSSKPEVKEGFSTMVSKVINSNPNLAGDFKCSKKPEVICKLF